MMVEREDALSEFSDEELESLAGVEAPEREPSTSAVDGAAADAPPPETGSI